MTKSLRTVATMWYRPDHQAANVGCPLLAGFPAGLLTWRGVSPSAISRGTAEGGRLVVAWANEQGYLLEPCEDIHAARVRAVLLTPGGTYRCTLEFVPERRPAARRVRWRCATPASAGGWSSRKNWYACGRASPR